MDICDAYFHDISCNFNRTFNCLLNWAWGITVIVIYGIGYYAAMKIEDFKKVHKMDNYDRIVAFMNGKDPSEVQTTKARNIKTGVLSFIAFVGAIILIALISMYLANKFL